MGGGPENAEFGLGVALRVVVRTAMVRSSPSRRSLEDRDIPPIDGARGPTGVVAARTTCEPVIVESALDWKRYYAAERSRLGRGALRAHLAGAVPMQLRDGGAIIVPHTRIEVTGHQIAAAVATVLASGVDRVLALGVLHGARRADRDRVAMARSGDRVALAELRGVHDESGLAAEEFSLDGFVELLELAANDAGRRIDVVRRYPFLVGDDPATVPGIEDLQHLLAEGAMLVATTDPVHHGHAYGTCPGECLDHTSRSARHSARSAVDAQFAALRDHRFADFAHLAERHRSDFRDTGPVTAYLVGEGFDPIVHDLELVDYASALGADRPSWVAGALVTV